MLSVLATGAVGQVHPFKEKQLRVAAQIDFAADKVRFVHVI